MDVDIDIKLQKYLAEMRQAIAVICSSQNLKEIDSLEFQLAVCEKLKLEPEPILLLNLGLKSERMVELLKGHTFTKSSLQVLQTIELETPILPSDLPQILEEQTIKAHGEQWQIHQNDADPYPSSPHAHSRGYSLHLGTGELFLSRRLVSRITCKQLREIRSQVLPKFDLPPLSGPCGKK